MSNQIRPMLAAKYTGNENLEVYSATPKLDGIRCLVNSKEAISRTGRPISNIELRKELIFLAGKLLDNYPMVDYLDGELATVQQNDTTWAKTSSIVMSYEKNYDPIQYTIFDFMPKEKLFYRDLSYANRFEILLSMDKYFPYSRFNMIHNYDISSHKELTELLDKFIEYGYEGIMLNHIDALYKHGRSVPNGELIKVKKWDYNESRVVGVIEHTYNLGAPERDRDGVIRRSKAQDNLIGTDTLGSLLLENGLRVGTGLTDKQRKELWENKPIGMICRYKYLPSVSKLPRHPVFVSWQKDNGIVLHK